MERRIAEIPPGGERLEVGRGHHVRLHGDVVQPDAGGADRYGAVAYPPGRVNDAVPVIPIREGPRTALGRDAGWRIGGRWGARGIDRARRPSVERHGASVPTRVHLPPASPPYSRIVRPRFGTWASPSTSYGCRARTGFPPAVWSHQSVEMAPDHAASGQLPHGRYNSASTKAAPQKSCYHPCRCCAPGRFSAPSLPHSPTGRHAAKDDFGRFRAPQR